METFLGLSRQGVFPGGISGQVSLYSLEGGEDVSEGGLALGQLSNKACAKDPQDHTPFALRAQLYIRRYQ